LYIWCNTINNSKKERRGCENKKKSVFYLVVLSLFIGTMILSPAYAENGNKILARKLAVATHYEPILNNRYGMALVSVQGQKEENLQISMIRITHERINEILGLGVYRESKRANFKRIIFIDITPAIKQLNQAA
jgi:adenine-specific DNA methylase